MHAIERPLLPRIGLLALGTVVLAFVVMLLAASRLGDLGLSAGSAANSAFTSPGAGIRIPPPASWYANPFAVPVRAVLPWSSANRR
jgi:hypothetical protein